MAVHIRHGIHDLASDMDDIPVGATRRARGALSDIADDGNKIAKGFARESAGKHGKHYHKAFSVEATGPVAFEYGPDAAKRQGGMSFEFGSRNQPPHLDLARSADIIAPRVGPAVSRAVGRSFWDG